jgi:transposase
MTKQSKPSASTPSDAKQPPAKTRRQRRTIDNALKLKIVLEALKEAEPVAALASRYEVHPNQIATWRKQFLASAANAFNGDAEKDGQIAKLEADRDSQLKKVGELTMDVEFLKKNLRKLGIPF